MTAKPGSARRSHRQLSDKSKIMKLRACLSTLRLDALMALDNDWDRSDDGFRDQIDHIDTVLEETK